MIEKETIKAYALENAIVHNGKAQSGNVLNSLFTEGLQKSEIKSIIPLINEVIEQVNLLTEDEQRKMFIDYEEFVKKRHTRKEGELPELEDATTGKVVMRFAPFPSGPLHIGHTRQAILNDEYVKKYKGKLLLVMDDTMGSEEKPLEKEAFKMIPEDLDWLGINYDKKIIFKSDRMQIYYDYAEELIKKGYLYVCSCTQEQMHELRVKEQECACRYLPEKTQLERWKKMFEAREGEYVVRLKTSMQDPDPAFRDRVMLRISEREHIKVGKKFRVWPLLDFSWAIDDHLLGMTHIIRGVELMIETRVEKFIWDIFKWKHAITLHTGVFKIDGVKISKSKGAKEVKSGAYLGWNDPRLWSLQSLRDRGILPETIREFILSMGLTKSNSTVAIDVLYSINRRHLEKVQRYFFVQNPEKLLIKGAPEIDAELPLHPSLNFGIRKYKTSQAFYIPREDFSKLDNGNYRLMHLLNFKSAKPLITKERDFSFISKDPEEKLKAKMVQWIPVSEDNIEVKIRMPDNSIITGLGEPALSNLKVGDIIQFERFGFVRLYKIDKKKKEAEFWFAHK